MLSFCTYFDINYSPYGGPLLESLIKHYPKSKIYVLALDKKTEIFIKNNFKSPNVKCVSLLTLLNKYPKLKKVQKNRSTLEFYWTNTPFLVKHVLNLTKDTIFYIDADVYFFSKSADIENFIASKKAVYLQKVDYPLLFKPFMQNKYGKYMVSINGFKYSSTTVKLLKKWSNQCYYDCPGDYNGNAYGEQLYLNEWPSILKNNLYLSNDKNANSAPWNVNGHNIKYLSGGLIMLDSRPLQAYHFHGFRFNLKGKTIYCDKFFIKKSASTIYLTYIKSFKHYYNKNKYKTPNRTYFFKQVQSYYGSMAHSLLFEIPKSYILKLFS